MSSRLSGYALAFVVDRFVTIVYGFVAFVIVSLGEVLQRRVQRLESLVLPRQHRLIV